MKALISGFFRATAGVAVCTAVTVSCSDPTSVDRLEERDQNTPQSIEISPADIVVREGDTASVRVIVRNAAGGQIQPGAPRYVLNFNAPDVEVINAGGFASTTFRVRGVRGGTSHVEFEVVPFASPGNGSPLSSVVQPIRGQARVKVVGTPTQLTVVSGDQQAALPGAALRDSIAVQAMDKRGKAVADLAISFTVASGGGTVSAATATTGSDGIARVNWKLGQSSGQQTLTAAAGDLAGPVITATAQPAASQIVHVAGTGQSAPASSSLPGELSVQVRDAANRGVAGVTVYWNVTAGGGTTSPATSLTDASGTAKASWTLGGTSGGHTLVAKAPGIGEVTFTATATSGLPPGVARVVASPESLTLDAINAQTKLSAAVYDAAGQPLKGQAVAWSSLSSGIATVDATGLVTARAVGAALIVATAGSVADTSTITVQPVATTIQLNTSSVVLTAGGTQQLQVTLRDAGGTVVANAPVTWTSSAPNVASVSSSGLVSAVAGGSAVVVASSGNLNAQAAVSVNSTVAPPSTGNGTVALQIVGFSTGNVLVSNGIPLAPGMLMPGDVGRVRLLVGSQEIPIFIKALQGRHRDGSVRSVLLQFMYNVGSTPVLADLVIGSPRTTQDRTETTLAFNYDRPLPAAVALPRSADYLMSTGVVMPTVPVSGSFNMTYEDNFVRQSDGRWTVFKPNYLNKSLSADMAIGQNYYDRAMFHWAWWVRTGEAKYWERAIYYMMAYRELYMRRYDYAVQPHQIQVEGIELHYLLTGDPESLRGVGQIAALMSTGWLTSLDDLSIDWLEGRIQSRVLLGLMTGHRLGFTDKDYKSLSKQAVDRILRTQSSDGAYRFLGLCNQQLNYMTGLVNEVLAKYYDTMDPDPRIPTSIGKSIDYMWNTQWRATDGSFNYASERNCSGVGGPDPAPDLNLIIVHGYGWMYKQTKNSVYRTRGDVIFNEGVKRAWLGSTTYTNADKQYNENYRSSFQYSLLRR